MNVVLPINSLAGRGHNSGAAPLSELLSEELADDRAHADYLLAAVAEARIENATDAGKVADLIVLIRDRERSLDRARDVRKRPYLMEQRAVEIAYGAVIGPLERARNDTLVPLLDAWQQAHGDAPIPASIASIGSRRKPEFVIEDLPAALDWLLKNHGGAIVQAARTIIGSHLRAMGVGGAAEANIPGVTISVVSKVQVR